MTTQAARPDRVTVNISINGEHYKLDTATVTGAHLLAIAGIPAGNQLFVDVPGNGDDDPVAPDQTLTVRSGMKFYDVPVGNLG